LKKENIITDQVPEIIAIKNKIYPYNNYYQLPIPENNKNILPSLGDEHSFRSWANSSACRRKYVGFWRIKNKKLFLWKIDGKFKLRGDRPILANWISETLFMADITIFIEKGIVIKIIQKSLWSKFFNFIKNYRL
jgi:hypothetical protein